MWTREQERARWVYDCVKRMEGRDRAKQYGRLCLRLPALIHHNGLCQAIAFFESKMKAEKPEYSQLLEDLAGAMGAPGREGLARSTREEQMHVYQRLTMESLACGQWFKRYAEAILKVDPTEDEE